MTRFLAAEPNLTPQQKKSPIVFRSSRLSRMIGRWEPEPACTPRSALS